MFTSIDAVEERLRGERYIAGREAAMAVLLAARLTRPLFVEGEPGTGKSALAEAIAGALGTGLVRLQCYPGIDERHALYEWNHARQLVRARMGAAAGHDTERIERDAFGEDCLIRRPLLEAFQRQGHRGQVLLIDDVDRADEPFDALLLDYLERFAVAIPGFGTVSAEQPPLVVLTSNGTRDVAAALKRRCLYLWSDYPAFEREHEILLMRVPGISGALAAEVCNVVRHLREAGFAGPPGLAESIDWSLALVALRRDRLDPQTVDETLGCLLKHPADIERFRAQNFGWILERRLDAAG